MAPGTTTSGEMIDLALDLAQGEPARATDLARAALADAALSPIDRSRALWALGLGRRELDDLDGSADALHQGIEAAHEAGVADLAAEIASSLAWVMSRRGDTEEALRLIAEAAPRLAGGAAARNEMQRGLILQRLGEHRPALDSYGLALTGLEKAGDLLAAARLRLNRSVIYVYTGELERAVDDLETAYQIGVEQGQTLLEAACSHNLAFAHGRRGDIPRSLAWFDVAEGTFARLGGTSRAATLRSDRAEVYAEAGLMRDALTDARAAVDELRAEDEPPALADALLMMARIADLAGEGALAADSAVEAQLLFEEQGRATWALMARYIGTLSTVRTTADPADLAAVLDLTSALDEEGWESEAARARIEAARLAFQHGDHPSTMRILEALERRRPASSDIDRVAHAEARFMLETARGREREAGRAIRRGLDLLDRHRAAMGSPEIRAGIAHHGVRLVAAAIDRALAAGDPWKVLQAVDTWRARSMDFPPALPPEDADLSSALIELRQVEAALTAQRTAGGDTADLLAQRRRIEETIRRVTRQVAGEGHRGTSAPGKAEVRAALDSRALVAYFTRRGSLHAVFFADGRWRLAELGTTEETGDDVASAVFSLSRLASAHASQASLAAAADSLDEVAARLSRSLVETLRLPDLPLTVVPTGVLHRLPWNALPALSGRPLAVAPSVRAWMRAAGKAASDTTTGATLVAGPDLAGARTEVERLSRLYPARSRLTGRNARVERVLNKMDGAAVAHLAAHGTFRTDNPLFSSLRMADGPLTVYDLERLRSVPRVVVMPACDTAVSDVGAGDELLGLAAALLRIGVSSLVAPTVPIPDTATTPLMIGLHRRILAGSTPEVALAETLAHAGNTPHERAAGAGFVLLGA